MEMTYQFIEIDNIRYRVRSDGVVAVRPKGHFNYEWLANQNGKTANRVREAVKAS